MNDENQDYKQGCAIAGHFPHLPPTPAPYGFDLTTYFKTHRDPNTIDREAIVQQFGDHSTRAYRARGTSL